MSHNQTELLKKSLAERILILDGAMGTMIQKYKLTELILEASVLKKVRLIYVAIMTCSP
ncbi:MAG: hypothetical protein ACLR5N_05370 [Haemophilus parainfluenzae]